MVDQDKFDAALEEILDDLSGAQLLAIPGIYEIVSEEYNNDVLAKLREEEE